jgi:mannose-6-phosphate isomerase-like protein (cupin superfamily)
MQRRSFLKAASAMLPAAGLKNFALAQAAAPSTGEIHVVGTGQDRFGEQHSLGYSSILFKIGASETGGSMFVIEHTNLIKGGPPFHLHLHQEEWFYVMEGEVLFQIGDSRKHLHSGESILGPRNIPHTFSAIGEKPGRMIIAFSPARMMEEFFRATAVPNPPVKDAAFYRKYEIEMIGPPLKV